MKQHDSHGRIVTLKILNKRLDGLYGAIPAFSDTETSSITAGEIGVASSPRHLFEPMSVVVSSSDTTLAVSMERKIIEAGLNVQSQERMTSESSQVTVERLGQDKIHYSIRTPFGTEKGENIAENQTDAITEALINDSKSMYWITLNNAFQNPNTTRVAPYESGLEVTSGQPIDLQISTGLEGYICILAPDSGGKVTIFYPNDRSDPHFKALARAHYDFREIAKLRPIADKPTPTFFIVLVSETPRPLSSFVPLGFRGNFQTWNGEPIGDIDIGPGWLHESSQSRPPNIEWTPTTWDVSKIVINVKQATH